MDTVVSITLAVLCGSAAVFFWFAIAALRRAQQTLIEVSKTLEAVSTEMIQLNQHVMPVVDNLRVATDNVRTVTTSVAEQVNAFKNVVDVVNQFALDIREFEKEFKRRVESPVLDAAQYIAAAAKGIRTFVRVIQGK